MLVAVDATCSDQLIRGLIAGDRAAVGLLVERAAGSDDPTVLVAVALVVPAWPALLQRAAAAARGSRDRQVVAVAAAYLSGDTDRALLLARDHLARYAQDLIVAHIAAVSAATPNPVGKKDDR
jgi:hypothetical protein